MVFLIFSMTKTQLTSESTLAFDYKNLTLLKKFITEQGKIQPRRLTKLTAKEQRALTRAVKQARILALLPFMGQN